jgi:hypothetical protein
MIIQSRIGLQKLICLGRRRRKRLWVLSRTLVLEIAWEEEGRKEGRVGFCLEFGLQNFLG